MNKKSTLFMINRAQIPENKRRTTAKRAGGTIYDES